MRLIFLRACGLALLLTLAPSVWAQTCTYFDAFKDNQDGTVTDPRSGTVWQVCYLGQDWNSSGCTGRSSQMYIWDAVQAARASSFLGKTDWRLPTKTEAVSIVGKFDSCRGKKRAVANAFEPLSPEIDELGLGKTWSLSPQIGKGYKAWTVRFSDGLIQEESVQGLLTIARLVRAGSPSSLAEFNREFTKIKQYERDIAAQSQQDQAAWNAANEARNNAQACGRLYAGKPTSLSYPNPYAPRQTWTADAMIVGVGNQTASARVIGGVTSANAGYGVGSVHERSCNDF